MRKPKRQKTHCYYGHELTPENIYLRNRGRGIERECRICRYTRNKTRILINGMKIQLNPQPKKFFIQANYINDFKEKAYTKLGNKCAECNNSDYRVLQIHHINYDGKTDRQINKAVGVNLYRLIIEGIDNTYQLLCANCHLIKHSRGPILHQGL